MGSLRYVKSEVIDATLPRKALKRVSWLIVPETNTGRYPEYGKALERTLLKELGKMTP